MKFVRLLLDRHSEQSKRQALKHLARCWVGVILFILCCTALIRTADFLAPINRAAIEEANKNPLQHKMSRWAKYDYSTPGVVDFSPEPYFVLFALLLLVYVFVCVTLALRVLYRDKNHCPRCGYSRPGVHGTVCPECGTGYTLAGKPAAPATGKGSNHSA